MTSSFVRIIKKKIDTPDSFILRFFTSKVNLVIFIEGG